ncbi:MAG: hypothetical protein H7A37_05220 [Chlamydiales bacterium]|nr:hypothetical protein [Chlamydiia bacterium]MCP5507680.1 hypothetical protein [Chlamydiales bacterium]
MTCLGLSRNVQGNVSIEKHDYQLGTQFERFLSKPLHPIDSENANLGECGSIKGRGACAVRAFTCGFEELGNAFKNVLFVAEKFFETLRKTFECLTGQGEDWNHCITPIKATASAVGALLVRPFALVTDELKYLTGAVIIPKAAIKIPKATT